MRSIFLLLVLAYASLPAQVVEWTEDTPIDVAVSASEGSNSHIRMVQLPCTRISKLVQAKDDAALTIEKVEDRTLSIQVTDPAYTGGIRILDDAGRLYVLNIYAAADGATVDDVLIVRLPQSKQGGAANQIHDTDAAVTHLMAVMAGGVSDPSVATAPVTQVERGTVVVGRVVSSDDQLSIAITRVYRAQPPLVGYETTWTWRGSQAVSLPIQRMWFPGAVAVTARQLGTLSATSPSLVLEPATSTKVWYVYVE